MPDIGRVLTAMVTPFTDDGSRVDYAQAQRLARALLDSGSDGLVVTGTTGESPTLSHQEKVDLWRAVKEAVGDRGAVIAGSGTYSTAESSELSQEAARLGVDGLLLVVPYYNRPTPEGLYRHFEAIARATSLPCILYNVPGRTGTNLDAATCVRLSQVPNIIGAKEASGNLSQAAKIIDGARPGFRVWSGNDEDTLPILAVGGYGVVSVISHLAGTQIKEMIDNHLSGQVEAAARLHRRLLSLRDAMFIIANPIPVKFALNEVGFHVGPPRLPLYQPDEATAQKIRAELARHQIDLMVPA